MKLLAALTALTLGLASATPSHTSYTLHRRLVDPSRSTAPFTPYGTVETDIDVASYALALQLGTGGVVPPKGRFVKAEGKEREGGETVDLDRAWVQLAVAVAGRDEKEWPRSAVRACHLLHADKETITLHLSTHSSPSSTGDLESHPTLQPYGITYRIHSNVSGSGCPEEARGTRVPLNWDGNARDVEVVLKTKDVLPSPRMSSPLPNAQAGATGATKPPVEQSFFQKYWIYIAGAGVAIALVGTQEPPAQGAK
ncbi:hypothetical protein QFC20_001387 [Naganishia adeliensis]|uniref:Uncharacterized protein n=1 Tax=Naganishia adeliensis TaxID=92952 RepID=A0ACC2WTL9_9TREE|nr:hypothetical protein QFC20_001387 [Naganishia adeliensis]